MYSALCMYSEHHAPAVALRLQNTYSVRVWKRNTRARRIDLMERTEEVTQVRESMNSGIIITNNSWNDKLHPQKRRTLIQ